MRRLQTATLLIIFTCLGAPVDAHYLWVKVSKSGGDHGIAEIYFEESASPGDGHYLDPFLKTKSTWIRTVEKINRRALTISEKKQGDKKRWVIARLPEGSPRGLETYWKFGVYRYGKTDVLLHYYARYLDVGSHADLHELARAEKMRLDMVPHDVGDEMEVRVVWDGLPAKNKLVYVRGPKGFRVNLKTNNVGKIKFKITAKGEYSFRTSVEEKKAGTDNGKDYSLVRHHATLIMPLPLSK